MPAELPPTRRVVTGHDSKNVAKVLMDGPVTQSAGATNRSRVLMWCTDGAPCDISIGETIEDMATRKLGTAPPPKGTRFTINDFPPGATGAMHRTETVDYAIVLAGEIDMDMDQSTVHLKAGDVIIQRGTEPARIAFVLIDAEPLGIGHPIVGLNVPHA
jgi:mannose-6-phosphate isomerase-like protein (cupin superfamily)